MTEEYYEKELKRAVDSKANPDYIKQIEILSKIDGSHKQHLKVMNNSYRNFNLMLDNVSEKKNIKTIAGQAWANGFYWALKHVDIINGCVLPQQEVSK